MINLEENIKKFFKRKLEIEETLSTSNLAGNLKAIERKVR